MNKLAKLIVITGIASVMLCTSAFAAEGDVADVNGVNNQTSTISLQGNVTADILNVRSGPSTSNTVIGKLSIGSTVNIISKTNNWYQIEYNSSTAYVCGDYINTGYNSILNDITKPSSNGVEVVSYAMNYLNVPYMYGGTTPSGFDCSGFVQYVMAHFGYSLPHSSSGQYSYGVKIEKSQLENGDLVFFSSSSSSSGIYHVGIYIGDGQFIHSPVPGQSVKIDSINSGYFASCYFGATRIVK